MKTVRNYLLALLLGLGLVAVDVNVNESRALLKAVAASSNLVSPTISNPTITGTATLADDGSFRWTTDTVLTRKSARLLGITGDGIGAAGNNGWFIGKNTDFNLSAIYASTVVPGATNYAFVGTPDHTQVNAPDPAGLVYLMVAGTTRYQLSATGFVAVVPSAPFGYGPGAGGTVTQATNKATGVTLSTPSGQITMNGAALNADTTVSFTLTNTQIAATDVLILNHSSGGTAGAYTLNAQAAAGSATINVRNVTGGNLSEAIVISFVLLKGASL